MFTSQILLDTAIDYRPVSESPGEAEAEPVTWSLVGISGVAQVKVESDTKQDRSDGLAPSSGSPMGPRPETREATV